MDFLSSKTPLHFTFLNSIDFKLSLEEASISLQLKASIFNLLSHFSANSVCTNKPKTQVQLIKVHIEISRYEFLALEELDIENFINLK